MFCLRSLGCAGEGVQREMGWGGGPVSCGSQPGPPPVMGKAPAFSRSQPPKLVEGTLQVFPPDCC